MADASWRCGGERGIEKKKGSKKKNKKNDQVGKSEKKKHVICFNCQKPGHYANKCREPKVKRTSEDMLALNVTDSIAPTGRRPDLAGISSGFPGYLASDPSFLASHQLRKANDLRGASSDYLSSDILLRSGAYSRDDIVGLGSRAAPGLGGGLSAGASLSGFSTLLEDPAMIGQRRDAALGIKPGISDLLAERSNPSLRKADSLSADESNILYVDGLPNDCTRREVAHLFRPFIGFKEIRVVHREPRRSGDKALVFCFVEFDDAKCALTALDALQGYKFDDKKPDAPVLRIQFANFPFRPPLGRDDQRR